jgi:outer membrane protein OmpA-like peptidoglycan-associated protein
MSKFGHSFDASVYFAVGESQLNPESTRLVKELSKVLRSMHNPRVIVDGYASTEGNVGGNLKLSEDRRRAVISLLGRRAEIGGQAYGESLSAEAEKSEGPDAEKSRQLNRCVEITILPERE